LSVRKPNDDFGGAFPIGGVPQIELGDNGVERLGKDRDSFRLKGATLVQQALQGHSRGLPALARTRITIAPYGQSRNSDTSKPRLRRVSS
jgi:hypothetical protein